MLQRVGTTVNCNLTKDRNRVDFTVIVKTPSEKDYLLWVKTAVLDLYPSVFADLQIFTETKYMKISFSHRETDLQVSLNVNNIAGVFNSMLIAHFNSIDVRFHRISVFMLRWHRQFLQFREPSDSQHAKPLHILSVYSLQMMLATWMQHTGQMARINSTAINRDTTIHTFPQDAEKLRKAMENHTALQEELRISKEAYFSEAALFT